MRSRPSRRECSPGRDPRGFFLRAIDPTLPPDEEAAIDRPGPSRQTFDRGADRARRARMVDCVSFVTVPVAGVFALVGWARGTPLVAAVFLGMAAWGAVPMWGLRRGWRLSTCAWWQAAVMLGVLLFMSLQPDGTRRWAIAWCSLVPFVALAIAGARTALGVAACTLLVQGIALGALYRSDGGAVPGPGFLPIELLDAWLLTAVLLIVGLALERAKGGVLHRLEESNEALAAEVAEHRRTRRRLEDTHGELVRSARHAGMAEVANCVLHNVGNALNSVHTSAAVVRDALSRTEERRALELAARLVAERKTHLEAAGEERVARLATYLERVLEAGEARRDRLQAELDRLGEQIAHIGAIISVQQENARGRGAVCDVDVGEILDEALVLVGGGLQRWGVEVVRPAGPFPVVQADRHQLLQILSNLLTNARDALRVQDADRRRIQIDVGERDDAVWIDVSDTGHGVPPELRERVFRYGFTTKSDGHGFGLHMSALAARAQGGSLEVLEEGILGGATFRLVLVRAAGAGSRPRPCVAAPGPVRSRSVG